MKKIVSPAQMAAADRATIQAGTPSLDLMEKAGAAVARVAIRMAGGVYGMRFVIVCGKGNNAGDGFVAARHIARRGGYPVVVLLNPSSRLSDDAMVNYERLRNVRVVVQDQGSLRRELDRASCIVDAIFGTGFKGEVTGSTAEAIRAINESEAPIVAVDIPSGVDGTTGAVESLAIRADVTVTMGALKTGLVLPPGCDFAGEVEIAEIGVEPASIHASLRLVEETDVAALFGKRKSTAHKRSVGTALIVAGSVGMSGAAALAAKGALRAGAGLVTVAAPASVALEIDQTVLEATTLPLPETGRGTIEASAIEAVLERAATMDAVAIGPGLSTDEETFQFVRKLTEQLEKPLVLDADALNAFSGDAASIGSRNSPTVLTPHSGELGRLLGITTAEVNVDRSGSGITAAALSKGVVILKGFRSLVVSPAAEAAVVSTGGPALATGGTGDVLTGVVVALLAAALDPFAAGWAAAWIHGRAGDVLASRLGERAVVASDLLEVLPSIMKSLEDQL